ncbi:MAG: methyltransferase domain-containing protein [Candidatus Omnitrophica bacterium]|nr:methyltransferase domain-containing protein [Candidatus Omnitrophota bacterium]
MKTTGMCIKTSFKRRVIAFIALAAFSINTLVLPVDLAGAQERLTLPAPGLLVGVSSAFMPPVLKGIKVYSKDPFRFDFILDKGNSRESDSLLRDESSRLIKYFLASLTVPEKDLWVNLSPYEKERIVPEAFGQTEMGRDLLAQDYLLKQITASTIYPEGETGKIFWKKVYAKAFEKYGTTVLPFDTFNKVWIIPEKARVYENAQAGTAYVVDSRLKVMLESDYIAAAASAAVTEGSLKPAIETQKLARDVMREVVIPVLEKEVNEGKNFSTLRQVYHSFVLAVWFKKKFKENLLSKAYADRNKVLGVNIDDPKEAEKIWSQYVRAFKAGVYNYVKEEPDQFTGEIIPRKFFSGGVRLDRAEITYSDVRKMKREDVEKLFEDLTQALSLTSVVRLVDEKGNNRLSELDVLRSEIDQIFERMEPSSFEKIQNTGVPFNKVVVDLLINYVFMKNEMAACNETLNDHPAFYSLTYKQKEELIEAFLQVLMFASSNTADGLKFIRSVAKVRALTDIDNFQHIDSSIMDNFPGSLSAGKLYLDLASGPNFAAFMPYFNEKITYMAVDQSPFVVEYLNEIKKLLGLDNVEILQQDVRQLEKPQQPVGVIRVKNVWNYVPGFEKKLREMVTWLGEGGQLIIMTDPVNGQRDSAIEFMNDLAKQLIAEGWDFEFSFGDQNMAVMDKMVFTKKAVKTPAAVNNTWDQYIEAYARLIHGKLEKVARYAMARILIEDGAGSDFGPASILIKRRTGNSYEDTDISNDIGTHNGAVAFNRDGRRYYLGGTKIVVDSLSSSPRPLNEDDKTTALAVLNDFVRNNVESTLRPLVEGKIRELSSSIDNGGIDFNPGRMDMQVQNSGDDINFSFDPAMIQQLQHASGLSPIIIDMQPFNNAQSFFGLSNGK